jgi:hypothetical protein
VWRSLSAALAAIVRGVPWTFDTGPAYLLSLAHLVFGIAAAGVYKLLSQRQYVGAHDATNDR